MFKQAEGSFNILAAHREYVALILHLGQLQLQPQTALLLIA